jgi:hypothetical protein
MVRQEIPLRYGYSVTMTRFTLTYSDLTALAAGTTPQTINLADASANAFQVAQGGLVLGVRAKLDTAFAAPSLATLTMTIGKNGDLGSQSTFFTSTAFSLMGPVGDNVSILEALCFKAGQDAAFGMNVTFTGDGTYNLNTVTAGQVHIDVYLIQPGPINTQLYPTSVTP